MPGLVSANGLGLTGKVLRAFASAGMASPSTRPLGGYSGVTPGTTSAILSVTSSQWTVQPFGGFLDVSAAGDAATPFAFLDVSTGGVTGADSSNARADLLWVRHDDPDETNDNSKPAAAFLGYTAGLASSAPQLPATPARAIPLARIDVPKLNSGAPTITLIAPFTVAAGGILPVSGSAAYPTSPYRGQFIDDATLGLLRWDGSAWQPFGRGGDTGWVTCGAGNSSISGTAKVRRIRSQVFGQIGLTNSSPWPNSQFTLFTLPDASWAPITAHRMSGGGPNQSTAGHINLIGNPGSTSVLGGATGAAGSVFNWSGPLWLTD